MARTLEVTVLEILESRRVLTLDDFMNELFKQCWSRGVICLKWVTNVENGRIRRFCTDAWEVLKRLEKRGLVEIGKRKSITMLVFKGGKQ